MKNFLASFGRTAGGVLRFLFVAVPMLICIISIIAMFLVISSLAMTSLWFLFLIIPAFVVFCLEVMLVNFLFDVFDPLG